MAFRLTAAERKQVTETVQGFVSKLESIAADWQAAWDDRSESWQESDAGGDAAQQINDLGALADDFNQLLDNEFLQ